MHPTLHTTSTVHRPFSHPQLILAPMAGITEPVFRMLCKKHGADIVVTEMVSVEALYRQAKPALKLMDITPGERPVGIQLFGADPKKFAWCAAYIDEHIGPDFIDLNCGCPAPKIVKKNGGSALLKDEKLYARIIESMVQATSVPVTVKIRSGWEMHTWVDVAYAKIAQECGAAAITVHPRSKTMGFSGHSFRERIGEVKNAVSIPVVGNGDVRTPRDALDMFEQTGCDSIMIGRGTYGNPWLFDSIKKALKGEQATAVSRKEKIDTAREHLNAYCRVHGEHRASREMKKHISWYIKGIPQASQLRNDIFRSQSVRELQELLHSDILNDRS
ncbi:MAG: tRNA dihydrouridine synthase DusB [Chitinivibrionales bacterium]|nr:tRNA dihydrouridine synthase DusB [Chitinivibrionales bacterium]